MTSVESGELAELAPVSHEIVHGWQRNSIHAFFPAEKGSRLRAWFCIQPYATRAVVEGMADYVVVETFTKHRDQYPREGKYVLRIEDYHQKLLQPKRYRRYKRALSHALQDEEDGFKDWQAEDKMMLLQYALGHQYVARSVKNGESLVDILKDPPRKLYQLIEGLPETSRERFHD